MSAQANLAGLFYPSVDDRWNEDISWIPIPVHTVSKTLDSNILTGRECPKYNAAFKTYLNESPVVKRIFTEHSDLISFLSEKCGTNFTDFDGINVFHNTLSIEKAHNFP